MASKQEIAKVLAMLEAASLPRQAGATSSEASGLRLDVWCNQFADVPYAVMQAAAMQYLRDGKWFPVPADIHAIIDTARRAATTTPTAAEAWALMGRGHFDAHPLIAAAYDRFGAQRFRERLTEDEGTNFAQFRGIYEQLASRAEWAESLHPQMAQLLGGVVGRMRIPGRVTPEMFVARKEALMLEWAQRVLSDGL